MGEKTGFMDKTQGTLFFEIERILKAKRPPFFFLENVKHILNHNKGNNSNNHVHIDETRIPL